MTIEIVKNYFQYHNINKDILEFPVSSATVELAAQAAGCLLYTSIPDGQVIDIDPCLHNAAGDSHPCENLSCINVWKNSQWIVQHAQCGVAEGRLIFFFYKPSKCVTHRVCEEETGKKR